MREYSKEERLLLKAECVSLGLCAANTKFRAARLAAMLEGAGLNVEVFLTPESVLWCDAAAEQPTE